MVGPRPHQHEDHAGQRHGRGSVQDRAAARRDGHGRPFTLAAKKLLNDAAYTTSGNERAWVLTTNLNKVAEIDDVEDVQENDHVIIAFDGADFKPASTPASQAASASSPRGSPNLLGFMPISSSLGGPSSGGPSNSSSPMLVNPATASFGCSGGAKPLFASSSQGGSGGSGAGEVQRRSE